MSLRLFLAAAALAASGPAIAATVIDFEGAPVGALSPTTYAPTGAVLNGFEVFDSTFGGAVVVPSGSQYVNASTGATITFTSGAVAGTVNTVSFTWAGLNASNGFYNGSTIDARDRFGNLLDTVSIAPEGPGETVSPFVVTLSGVNIASLTFTGITNPRGSGLAPLDDLTFGDVTAVPEPATWALMIAGFGLVGVGLRRKLAQTA